MIITLVEKIYDHKGNCNMYKAIMNDITKFVPLDEANTDYQAIQEWISEGNTIIDNPPE
jgi:hypothetical protein